LSTILALLVLFAVLWTFFAAAGHFGRRLLHRTAKWTAHFRYGDYVPVLVTVAMGLGGAMLVGNGFAEIAESVRNESVLLQRIDSALHAWARHQSIGGLTLLFVGATWLGSPVCLGGLVALVATWLAVRGRWRWAAYIALTSGIGALLNLQLKAWFARSRPDLAEALVHTTGYSFPSGHAMGSAVVFGALSYLAVRVLHVWTLKASAAAFLWTAVVVIAASRVYLGVHWVSDVAAGIAAGIVWVVSATLAYETSRRIRLVRALRRKRESASAHQSE
jgi:undecaprenyl-diphosphatase